MMTRRTATKLTVAGCYAKDLLPAPAGWNPAWDRAVIDTAVIAADQRFDPIESMLRRSVGGEYRYHTNLRNIEAHPTRDSAEYAMMLFEVGRASLANEVLGKVLSLQDIEPKSKWYGLWSYYLEEDLPQMAPADWNWADFIGSYLLLIDHRHRKDVEPSLVSKLHEAIRHAAGSIRRRNVSMNYTNIAVQGTFVTLAAAELLEDYSLDAYARERLKRFAKAVDETGSFAEYNSPTYANVTIANLTRMRMLVKHQESLDLIDDIHHRAWLHVASHWHAPTRQLAGPMSRAYSTDIGYPLWLQKALDNRLMFVEFDELRQHAASGEVGLLDYRVPSNLAEPFLRLGASRQHRELFLPGVQGTTWLTPGFALGSVNRGDFWVQRRPLLAYWGSTRPVRYAQLRVVKNDYDFSSALLYSTQQRGCILGMVGFRVPGGDKHISLDPLPPEFEVERLRIQLDVVGFDNDTPILADGEPSGDVAGPFTRLSLELDEGVHLGIQFREAAFGAHPVALSVERQNGRCTIALDLLKPGTKRVRWADIGRAYAVFTLTMHSGPEPLEEFDRILASAGYDASRTEWNSPEGRLRIEASREPGAIADQNAAFREYVDGKPTPHVRLSNDLLV